MVCGFEESYVHDGRTVAENGKDGRMTVGENIKRIRKERHLSQRELGEKLGISQQMVGQYENNPTPPKLETLQKIATALDVPVYILDDRIKYTTNHEKLSQIFNSTDSVDVAAVESLLAKIQDDYEKGMFEQNSGQYLTFYKSMKEWLESEAEE